MKNNGVTVIDIGTQYIIALFGDKGIYNTFEIKGISMEKYSGFTDGNFFMDKTLKNAIHNVLRNIESQAGEKISKICVGVPSEFATETVIDGGITLSKKRKITLEDVRELEDKVAKDVKIPNASRIDFSPIAFTLDDNYQTYEPVGQKSKTISAKLSLVFVKQQFQQMIISILKEYGVRYAKFVSENVARGAYLLEPNKYSTDNIIIDCGYLSTNVSLYRGGGFVDARNFSLGGGHLASDLMSVFKIPFASAERLKNKAVLTLQTKDLDKYSVKIKNQFRPLSAKLVNETIIKRIKGLASAIRQALDVMQIDKNKHFNLYLTGGGISYINGCKDILSKELNKNVELLVPNLPLYNKPVYSTIISLLYYALY